jgi:hypothetical protein
VVPTALDATNITLNNNVEQNDVGSLTCNGTWQYASDLYLAWDPSGSSFYFTLQLQTDFTYSLYLDDINFGGL